MIALLIALTYIVQAVALVVGLVAAAWGLHIVTRES